ncbi:MAG: S8 family serine peptidase [Candidatus Latescibacterota bacterium]|nr:MAG: S8 family serine peptidase [Candidatus Latescibacterota bacterium]
MDRGPRRLAIRLRPLDPRIVFFAALLIPCAQASAFEPQPVPGRLVIQLHERIDTERFQQQADGSTRTFLVELEALHARFAAERFVPHFPHAPQRRKSGQVPALSRFYILEFAPEHDLESVRAAYEALDAVEIAAFDWVAPLHLETNDFTSQWHLESTSGRDAHVTGGWNHSIGDTNVVLAILDSGVDWMHPDLGGAGPAFTNGNIAINWEELHGEPGVDDDANGRVDDVRGWDFVSSFLGSLPAPGEDATVADNDPMDFNGHGTHVAGIAGAITNNGIGVAGVGYNCKILPLRIGGSASVDGGEQGVVWMSFAASAIAYATQQGATAINCSWGSAWTPALQAAVDQAIADGVVVVVSSGNDNSQNPSYLSSRGDCFDVAASSSADVKAGFSNYGDWIDITAPGVGIFSTFFDHALAGEARHTYRSLQGTSMAAPVVTGLVGLVKSRWPSVQGAVIHQLIQNGATDIDALNPAFAGFLGAGRVNALRTFFDTFLAVPGDYPSIRKALTASSPGDTIALVGGATYSTDLLMSQLDRSLQGGWSADFASRDPGNHTTIVGSGAGPVLRFAPGVDETLILESLRITGGRAQQLAEPSGAYGGGILCIDASPLLRACVIEGNGAGGPFDFGGGGGGFFMRSSARLVDCVFSANAARQGAGLAVLDSNLELAGCVIEGNSARGATDARGAGIHVEGGSLTIRGGRFEANHQAQEGGALYSSAATLDIRATHFVANSAALGGAMASRNSSTLLLASVLFRDNAASQLAAVLHATQSTGTIANATLDANSGNIVVFLPDASSAWSLRNCIISNHASGSAALVLTADTELDYNLSWNNAGGDVFGASKGAHATQADPRFVDRDAGDLALGLHSPALDSGDPDARFSDRDGTRNDRGGFGGPEAQSAAPAPPVDLRATTTAEGIEVSWRRGDASDVGLIALYRDADSTFAPSEPNFLVALAADQVQFLDAGGAGHHWYRVAAVGTSGASSGFTTAVRPEPPTGVEDDTDDTDTPPTPMPSQFALHPNEPNPFNPSTRIRFDLARSGHTRVDILDARGRLVRRLADHVLPAGTTSLFWDGRDEQGRAQPSGVYLYRVAAERWSAARKMTLLR